MSATMAFSPHTITTHAIAIWKNQAHEKRPRLISFIAAIVFHAVLFLMGGLVFVQAPEYGVDSNQGGVDIYLVAAPALPNSASAPEAQPVIAVQQAEIESSVPKPVTAVVPPEKKIVNTAKEFDHRGDGSSSTPGESATTLSSTGSGFTEAKPGYLKNEPPAYPSRAVDAGQEGLVMLHVAIDRHGRAQQVDLKQSSGFSLLDTAAIKAVKKWKFSPARMGALTVDAQVDIPVRFRLEDAKKNR